MKAPSPWIAPAKSSAKYAYACERRRNESSDRNIAARAMPWSGTTFSWFSDPNCGVFTTLPVSVLMAIDMPPRGDANHSSPVKYQGTPSRVVSVDEQKYSYRSVPSTA